MDGHNPLNVTLIILDINAVLLRWTTRGNLVDGVGMIVHVAVVLITEYKVNLKKNISKKKFV